jgi:hypothetical protein
MRIEQNEKRKRERGKREKKEKIIVVMASRRRAMKELGRVTFSPDTTSAGGSPGSSLGDSLREKEKFIKT